ncbi:MAG: hypothetical protein IJV68_05785 [Clostridia bacterium]|nr:hypothetical protein [Clostridia bacterium]
MEQKDIESTYVKKTELYVISSVLILFIIIFGIILLVNQRPEIIINPVISTDNTNNENVNDVFNDVTDTNETETTEKVSYIVKEYNGKISVYKNNALVYTMDVYTFTLPEYDRNLLACGIPADSIEELYRILEEYYV